MTITRYGLVLALTLLLLAGTPGCTAPGDANSSENGTAEAATASPIEDGAWADAQNTGTIRSMNAYLAAYPSGVHAAEARRGMDELRNNSTPYDVAVRTGRADALETFLTEYPGHTNESDALAGIRALREQDVRSLDTLARNEQVDLEISGSKSVTRISLTVTSRMEQAVSFTLPVGTIFRPVNTQHHDVITLMAVQTLNQTLTPGETLHLTLPVTLLGTRGIDATDAQLEIRADRPPDTNGLLRLLPALKSASPDTAAAQAAVWIVTENANYRQLGVLIDTKDNSRVIGPAETREALDLLRSAGFTVENRPIWNDRGQFLNN